MNNIKNAYIEKIFANASINVLEARYVKCWEKWCEKDYVPRYSKLYYILDGEGWLKIKGKEYYPKKGQMFLMPEGVLQSYSSINKNYFLKYYCHFSFKIGGINIFDTIDIPFFIDVADSLKIKELFLKLINSKKEIETTSSLKTKAAMLEIIAYYFDSLNIQNIHIRNNNEIRKLTFITEYVEKNLSKKISVEMLADIAHFHPVYFTRFFKQHIGVTPSKYIKNIRLNKAQELIEKESFSYGEIAAKTGFYDVFHFSREFKKKTGYSPSDYKKYFNVK